ncbi:MAG: DUF1552 domain-containing protein [Polyangiaceae bacterium]|nr:DUF1552 domain-containing protein [Polyangiaceae bacterium]
MNRLELNRRRFLKSVGATALTYPFLKAVPSYAAGGGDPKYMVLIFTPCGVVRYLWGAQGPARPMSGVGVSPLTGASGSGAFRATLAPFSQGTDLSSKMILLDGLNVGTADGSHEAGMGALWTACLNNGPSNGVGSVSIDQAVAAQLNASTPFDTIPLMVRSSADYSNREIKTRMLYTASGGFVDPYDDPVAARSTIFPSMAGTTSGSTSSAAAGPDKRTFIRQQVFNQLNTELTSLQNRLCTDDRAQLQSLQQAWNDLDNQLAQAATAAASCMSPESAPAGYKAPSIDFPTSATLQMDILALALACDLTRIGSLQFSTATSQVTHTWIGSDQTSVHHDFSHQGPSSLYAIGPDLYNTAMYNQQGAAQQYAPQLAEIDLWYAQQIAYFAQKLNSLTTASGKNLLDQTVVCWGSELDMGAAHNHDDTPFILIGGAGGALKTGQLVQFPLNMANNGSNNPPTGNRFHNDLFITLAQAMGVSMSTFGTPSGEYLGQSSEMVTFVQGPIKEILA